MSRESEILSEMEVLEERMEALEDSSDPSDYARVQLLEVEMGELQLELIDIQDYYIANR